MDAAGDPVQVVENTGSEAMFDSCFLWSCSSGGTAIALAFAEAGRRAGITYAPRCIWSVTGRLWVPSHPLCPCHNNRQD